MPRITVLFALALIATGVGYYFGSGMVSITALIPAFIGVAFLICAAIARRGDSARKHAMHVVAVLSLASLFFTYKGVTGLLDGSTSAPTFGRLITFVLCLLLLVLCVNSFVQVRRGRSAG